MVLNCRYGNINSLWTNTYWCTLWKITRVFFSASISFISTEAKNNPQVTSTAETRISTSRYNFPFVLGVLFAFRYFLLWPQEKKKLARDLRRKSGFVHTCLLTILKSKDPWNIKRLPMGIISIIDIFPDSRLRRGYLSDQTIQSISCANKTEATSYKGLLSRILIKRKR